jgi:hypothetical protein
LLLRGREEKVKNIQLLLWRFALERVNNHVFANLDIGQGLLGYTLLPMMRNPLPSVNIVELQDDNKGQAGGHSEDPREEILPETPVPLMQ